MTKSKVRSKVIAAVATVAILAGVAGIMNEMAKARGFAFGWPLVVKTATKTGTKTTTAVKTPTKTTVKPKPIKTNIKSGQLIIPTTK
ncbi:MAG: hypothetical protein WCT18_00020 [Patescibacteria group bacterium]